MFENTEDTEDQEKYPCPKDHCSGNLICMDHIFIVFECDICGDRPDERCFINNYDYDE